MRVTRTAYWIVTILFCLFMLGSATGELLRSDELLRSMAALQFPPYILGLLGTLKLLGIVALLVPGRPTLKEWAYAGFTFDFVGAIYSIVMSQAWSTSDAIAAPVALVLCVTSYVLYKQQ